MKKVLLLCVAIAYFSSSFAQVWDYSKPDKRLTFGVRAGVNFTRMIISSGLPDDAIKSRLGFHVGANLDYNFNNSFALESGLFFTDKVVIPMYYGGNWHVSSHFCLLQIPVLVRPKFHLTNNVNIQMRAGGFAAFKVGGGSSLDLYNEYNGNRYKVRKKDFDTGIIVGLGLDFYNFYLGVQYERGLTELLATDELSAKTSNIAITLGYDF